MMEKLKNVPKVRFPEFSEAWKQSKLKNHIIDHKGGAPLKPGDFVEFSEFEVIPKKAINHGGLLQLDTTSPTFCSQKFFDNYQGSIVDKTYLITTLRDLVPSGPSIGYIVKFTNNSMYLLAQGVYGLKITESELFRDFLIHISNTLNYRRVMQTIMVGSTQVHIRNSDFFDIELVLPALAEQQKISSFLTAVDDKIQKLSKKKALLEQYKKGVMQKLFSQKLRFKDDQGNEYPDWEEQKLGTLCINISSGTTKPGIQGEYNVYGSTGILGKSHTHTHSGNFILVARVGANAGTVNIVDGNFAVTDNTLIVECRASIDVRFMYYLLVNMNLKRLVFGSGQPLVTAGQIKAQIIQLPSELEQRKIASFLSAIDNKISGESQQIEQTRQFKKGLLQQMFV
jgi:type I restriction enzyme S subunit